jgi:hypothetical protein
MYRIDFKGRVPSFKPSSWDNPARFCEHKDVEKVEDFDSIVALPLNRQRWFGDHSLKATDAAFVSAPVRFIGNKQDAVLKMAVELVDDMLPSCDLESMAAENSLKTSN